jgi:hypothetical protein
MGADTSVTNSLKQILKGKQISRSAKKCSTFHSFHKIQTESNLIFLRHILITPSHWRLSLPSILFWFLTKTLYASVTYPVHTTCPACLILLHLITIATFGGQHELWNSSLSSFLHPPVTSSLVIPNIPLSTTFWNTRNGCSSLSAWVIRYQNFIKQIWLLF